MRILGVAAAQAKGANTTLAVCYDRSVFRPVPQRTARNSPEQQGESCGHLLPSPQVAAAAARLVRVAVARAAVRARRSMAVADVVTSMSCNDARSEVEPVKRRRVCLCMGRLGVMSTLFPSFDAETTARGVLGWRQERWANGEGGSGEGDKERASGRLITTLWGSERI
jgi:hypothetical protein